MLSLIMAQKQSWTGLHGLAAATVKSYVGAIMEVI